MSRLMPAFLPGLILGASISACGGPPAPAPVASPHHATWSYAGASGPAHWSELDPSFALCAQGTKQSPIDLPHSPVASGMTLGSPHWDPVPLSVVNNGHSIQVDDTAPSALVVDSVPYSLAQFHFHAPAEHTLEGRAFDAEMHLVHRAPDGKLAVIALFFQKGAENAALRPLFDAIPMEPGSPRSIPSKSIDVGVLVSRASRFVTYEGSLTVPPCTEGVRWIVAMPDPAPLEMAEADLAKLRTALHGSTNRPTQPRNARSVGSLTP
jgi:carbonic anhydrase